MATRSTDSLLWSCAPDAPALSRCHLAVHKPTRIDWLCWNGIVVVVVVVVAIVRVIEIVVAMVRVIVIVIVKVIVIAKVRIRPAAGRFIVFCLFCKHLIAPN